MRKKKEETRNLIYRTAMGLFLSKGYENTPVDEIVERAGVSKGTFFNYFPAKTSILEQWFLEWIRDVFERAELTPGAELDTNLTALVQSMAGTDPRFLTITGWLIVEGFTARLRGGRSVPTEGPGEGFEDEPGDGPIIGLILQIIEISAAPRPRDNGYDPRGSARMLGNLWYGTILVCIEHPEYNSGQMLTDAVRTWYRGKYDTSRR